MFKPIGGSVEVIMGLEMHLPPEGFVYNVINKQLEERPIYSTSDNPEEQVWKPIPLPENYEEKREQELNKQENDPNYIDPELEQFRRDMWDRRLNGMWMKLNGKNVYITGTHFYYLNFYCMDVGLPDYRNPDRKYFYYWRYIEQDPNAFGIFEITGRRGGKSSRAGAVVKERTTKRRRYQAGIQSKTGKDAEFFFEQRIVLPYRLMVDFFKPVSDFSKGDMPKQRMEFKRPSMRGGKRKALLSQEQRNREDLRSSIEARDSGVFAFDGYKMQTYVADEVGKTELDVYKRHNVVKMSLVKGSTQRIIGKAIYTTTVEDISNIKDCLRLWKDSDPLERNKNGRTKSGLYRFFTPADELDNFDKYGMPDVELNRKFILAEREAQTDLNDLNDIIRKNPLNPSEAFRVSSDTCIYHLGKIIAGMDRTQFMREEDLFERGNIKFIDGVLGNPTYWEPNPNGRWKLAMGLEDSEINKFKMLGDRRIPMNQAAFSIGVDPFDHKTVTDSGRKSRGAIAVYAKPNAFDPSTDRIMCIYLARPDTPQEFYTDVLATAFFFGVPYLCENQKPWCMQWHEERGFSDWYVWIPGSTTPGINANGATHQELANETEEYINRNYLRHPFYESFEGWKEFSLADTKKFDLEMAEGWALIGAKQKKGGNLPTKENVPDISKYFRKKKIKQHSR